MAWPSIYGIDGSQLLNTSEPRKPSIVLVHDAFLVPTHLAPLRNELLDLNYRVLAPQLPSTGYSFQPDILEADIDIIVDAAKPELRAGCDIVMVLFGYGAVPGTLAADRLNLWSLETPRAGTVLRFVFLSALLLESGECVRNALSLPPGSLEIGADRMLRLKTTPSRELFQPCSPAILSSAVSAMQLLNCTALTTPNPHEAWTQISAVYFVCELDNNLEPSLQENYAARLQAKNRHSRIVRVPFGHAPFLTHTAQLCAIIDRLASTAQ